MGLADDLLAQAYHLLNKDGDAPIEASLRRAVSTAYYALFHLLIGDAVGNWGITRQRSELARTFNLETAVQDPALPRSRLFVVPFNFSSSASPFSIHFNISASGT